jgi:hypothetical protein
MIRQVHFAVLDGVLAGLLMPCASPGVDQSGIPYRTWLAEKGTGPEVQRDLMRHSTIAMSLDGLNGR